LDLFVAAGDILAPFGIVNPLMAPWRSGAGLAAAALGERERALAFIDEEVSIAERAGLQISLGVALRARGLVQDDPSVAQASLQASVTALEGQDAPLELAKTLADLGSLQRRQGQRRAARKPLRRALDLASRCPATALEQHVLAELAAAGARPRNTKISGASALTPSEQRIARLAADGYTNREIAEQLFLTQNTVAWHLKHVFRKLEVDSRTTLATRLAGNPRQTGR
jgi:DNA-binding NarL/FixJ family response regulator